MCNEMLDHLWSQVIKLQRRVRNNRKYFKKEEDFAYQKAAREDLAWVEALLVENE